MAYKYLLNGYNEWLMNGLYEANVHHKNFVECEVSVTLPFLYSSRLFILRAFKGFMA